MKLRLPNKLIAAIMAAASPVLFSTLSTATLGAAAVAAFSQQAESADTWAYNSATNTTTHTDDEGNVTTYAGRVYTWMGKNADLHGSEAGAWQYVDDENGTPQNSTIWSTYNNNKTNGFGFLAHGDAAATTSTIRFTASGGTKPAAFSFSPFAVTGIIVEKGAEGYVVQGNTSASRSIILGSTSVEGRSDIAENFSLVTTNGPLTLRGKQTISTSAGATFTLQAQETITVESTADVTFAGAGKTSLASALQVNKKIAIADGATLALQKGATFADGASLSGSGNLVYEGTSAGVNINFAGADISGWTGAFINKSEQAVLLTMTKNNLYVNADINVSEGATGAVNLDLGIGDKFFTGTSRLNNITHNTNYTLQIRQYGDMTITGKVQTGRLVVGESEADSYTVFTLDGADAFLRNSNDTQHDYAAQVQGWGSFVLKNGATQTLSGFNDNSHMKFVADGVGSALTINGAVSTLSGLQVMNGGSITIGANVTAKTLTSDAGSFTVNSGKTLTISGKTYINQPLVVNGEGSVSLAGAIYVNVPRTEEGASITYSGGAGYEGSGFRTYKAGSYTITSAAERVTIADGTAWYMGDKAVTDSASYSAGTLTLASDVTDSAIYYVNSNLSYNQTEMDSADAFEVAAGVTFSASGFRLGQPNGRGAAKVILNEGSVLHGLASEESGSGGNTGTGKRQIESLTLKGDATAEVDHDFGIIQNGHGGSSLNLNGHTLTLTQSAEATEAHNFYLSNTAISNGKIVVEKGVIFNSTNNGVGLQTNTLIENHGTIAINTAQNGVTDLLVRTEGDGDINLNVNATINNSSVTKSTGTLTIGNNATLTFGTADGQNNSMASFSQVVLNNGKIYWRSAASSINNLTVGSGNGTLQIYDINASPIVLEGTTTLNGKLTLTNSDWGEKLTIRKLTGTGNFENTSTGATDTLTVTMEQVENYRGTILTTNPKTRINATLGHGVAMSGVKATGGTISLTATDAETPSTLGSMVLGNNGTISVNGEAVSATDLQVSANATGTTLSGTGSLTLTRTDQDYGIHVAAGGALTISMAEVTANTVHNKDTLTIGDGTNETLVKTKYLVVGNREGGTSSLTINSNATVATSGGDNTGNTHQTGLVFSEWSNSSTVTISGNLLAKNASLVGGRDTSFTLNIEDGGVVAVKGILSRDTSKGYTVNLKDGGSLIFGGNTGNSKESLNDQCVLNAAAGSTIAISADAAYNGSIVTTTADDKALTIDTKKYAFNDDGTQISQAAAAAGGTLTLNGVISGTADILKKGAGTLVLSAANTYSGNTTITGGELKVTDKAAMGSGSLLTIQNGALSYNYSGSTTKTLSADSSNALLRADGGTLILNADAQQSEESAVALSGLFVLGGNLELSGGRYTVGKAVQDNGLFADTGHTLGSALVLKDGAELTVDATSATWRFQVNSDTSVDGNGGGIYIKGKAAGENGAASVLTAKLHGDAGSGTVSFKAHDVNSATGAHIVGNTAGGKNFLLTQAEITIADADYSINGGSDDKTVNNRLSGSAIINSGTGTLTVNNAANTLVGVDAEGGAILVQNAANSAATLKNIKAVGGDVTIQSLGAGATVNLTELTIAGSKTVSAYTGTPTNEQIAAAQNGSNTAVEATLAISNGTLTAGSGAKLNAHLTLGNNTTLNIADATVGGAGLTMGSSVTIAQNAKINLSDNIINGLNSLTIGEGLTLFSGVDAFNINGAAYNADTTYHASDFFNLSNSDVAVTRPWDFVVKFDDIARSQSGGVVYLYMETPEPATATLSLLALAALAARRRRK